MFSPIYGIIFGLGSTLIIGFLIWRKRFRDRSNGSLEAEQSIFHRNKYAEVDILRNTAGIYLLAMSLTISAIIMVFSWEIDQVEFFIAEEFFECLDEEYPPRTAEFAPVPPPPPFPQLLPEEDHEEPVQPKLVETTIIKDTPVTKEQPRIPPPPPPPPPPPESPVYEDIFRVIEEMPRFPGCEDIETKKERKLCSDKKLLDFIYSQIKYPKVALDNAIAGTVVIQFIVEKDGSIQDAHIIRDIGGGCGQEALRVVNLMQEKKIRWIHGSHRGRVVRVQFNLPIRFRLE